MDKDSHAQHVMLLILAFSGRAGARESCQRTTIDGGEGLAENGFHGWGWSAGCAARQHVTSGCWRWWEVATGRGGGGRVEGIRGETGMALTWLRSTHT